MLLISCGVFVAFIDHAGVYIIKLCPWCSLDLQDKLKQLPVLTLLAGQVFLLLVSWPAIRSSDSMGNVRCWF